ncbi:F-box/kelch-repeat protein At3g06240-like isoform X2 [Cynara cardunculus var. scolymus]|uniref:F-box/kelch-repeat protein At3g06240-like isoform X2 n=1 Tax=Cynara cardunculus var. scolymus TaxID=59895 RepID=UPI000D62A638|nr:F-box/kelch-repeat protein At3g06240-like isoform X2 [Cynara cardunculus var. scolymus]
MAYLPPEILEQILIRLKAHLKHSYERDRNDEKIGERRIVMSKYRGFNIYETFDVDEGLYDFYKLHMLGSSDGLVCVSPSDNEVLVVNPSTREVKKLTTPQIPEPGHLCWGFGYDASTDDYKVVLGSMIREKLTYFQVFSLRSNTWKVIGWIDYIFLSRMGILCEGALHWLAYRPSSGIKYAILSFSLSEEKFVEIPQPVDVSYQSRLGQQSCMRLGTIEGCLCAFRYENLPNDIWVLKGNNGKQSWEIFRSEREVKREVVHTIKQLRYYIPNKNTFCYEPYVLRSAVFLGSSTFVESLVSPHFHRRPRRRQAANTMRRSRVNSNNYGYDVPPADDGSISGAGAQSSMM